VQAQSKVWRKRPCAWHPPWPGVQEGSQTDQIDIPSAVYTGSCAELYVFIAQKVREFARACGIAGFAEPASPATSADSAAAAAGDQAQGRGADNGGAASSGAGENGGSDRTGGGSVSGRQSNNGADVPQNGQDAPPLGFCFSFPIEQTSVRRYERTDAGSYLADNTSSYQSRCCWRIFPIWVSLHGSRRHQLLALWHMSAPARQPE
jgi:hypothetical protein